VPWAEKKSCSGGDTFKTSAWVRLGKDIKRRGRGLGREEYLVLHQRVRLPLGAEDSGGGGRKGCALLEKGGRWHGGGAVAGCWKASNVLLRVKRVSRGTSKNGQEGSGERGL